MKLSLKQRNLLRRLCLLTDRGILESNQYRSWLRPMDLAGSHTCPSDALKVMAKIGLAEQATTNADARRKVYLYKINDAGRAALEELDGPGTHQKPEPFLPLIEYLEKGGVRQFGLEPAEELT